MPTYGWFALIAITSLAATWTGFYFGSAREADDLKQKRRRQATPVRQADLTECRWVLHVRGGQRADRFELCRLIGRRFPYFTLDLDDVEATRLDG